MGTLLSASQAAKLVGKSVPTITRAIKDGRLSAKKLDGGGYQIDPAELTRVWEAVTVKDNDTPKMLGSATPNETNVLQVKLEAKDQRIADLEKQMDDLKEQRDKWQTQAERLLLERPATSTALVPVNENPKPEKDTRGVWARIWNK